MSAAASVGPLNEFKSGAEIRHFRSAPQIPQVLAAGWPAGGGGALERANPIDRWRARPKTGQGARLQPAPLQRNALCTNLSHCLGPARQLWPNQRSGSALRQAGRPINQRGNEWRQLQLNRVPLQSGPHADRLAGGPPPRAPDRAIRWRAREASGRPPSYRLIAPEGGSADFAPFATPPNRPLDARASERASERARPRRSSWRRLVGLGLRPSALWRAHTHQRAHSSVVMRQVVT